MSSVIDICNISLSHLGDTATVASIDPPEGSAQAEHCARFYPIARDSLLEMHPWSFATRRVALSLLADTMDQWAYIYTFPNQAIKILAVIAADAADDASPQPFIIETLASGARVICTNQETAVVRYVAAITDSAAFSPLFTMLLTWFMSSMLAGPILKGDVGAAEAKRCYAVFADLLSKATTSDSNQRRVTPTQSVAWMAGR